MALLGSPGTARRSTSFRPVLAVMEREISGIRPGQRETMRVVSTTTAGRYTRSSHDSVVRRRCRRAANDNSGRSLAPQAEVGSSGRIRTEDQPPPADSNLPDPDLNGT